MNKKLGFKLLFVTEGNEEQVCSFGGCEYSEELVKDLKKFHNIDGDKEIVKILLEQLMTFLGEKKEEIVEKCLNGNKGE